MKKNERYMYKKKTKEFLLICYKLSNFINK